jgi:hypothetical protein
LKYRKVVIKGYLKISPPQLGFPFIVKVKNANAKVEGELYFDLSQTHSEKIDIVEGEGNLYHRIVVEVETIEEGDNQFFSGFTYYPADYLISQFYKE